MWQTGRAERETYDERDGVDVVDDIVGNVVELHDGGLRSQVSGHLVVGEPVDGVEQEAIRVAKRLKSAHARRKCENRIDHEPTHTLHADRARLTSSTHSSSKIIHAGAPPACMDGLALSQFRGPNIFLGFREKVPLLAARMTRKAVGLRDGSERNRE